MVVKVNLAPYRAVYKGPMRSARPLLLVQVLLVLGCTGRVEPETAARQGPRPNVVVLLADTLRADVLSFYGATEERAPFLSSIAGEATVFANTYSTSTWTAPSSASILTGVYPDRHGVTAGFMAQFKDKGSAVEESALGEMQLLSIARDVPTLAERMRSLGYRTYGLSSNLNIGPELHFDRGFDRFRRSENSVPAGVLFDMLREWKPEIDSGVQPYFLYMHLNDVHVPYNVRPRFYKAAPGREPVAESLEVYKSELGFLDFVIRNMYAEFGWDKNTLLVFLADHGEEFLDHGGLYHEFSVYNELSHVPFMLRAPELGVRARVVRENTSSIDVTPTILGLLGQPVDPSMDGRSLRTLCLGGEEQVQRLEAEALLERPLIVHRYELGQHLWSIVRERWKLIEGAEGPMLFDLKNDPGEQRNLAEEYPGLVSQLARTLQAHRDRGSSPDSVREEIKIDPGLLKQLRALGYVR